MVFNPILYAVNIDESLSSKIFHSTLKKLPIYEQTRILKYKLWKDRHRSLIAYMLVRKVIRENVNYLPDSTEIFRDVTGRPFLKNNLYWNGDFNISHSGNWVVVAISGSGRVGVDIEHVKPLNLEIADFCLSFREREFLHSLVSSKRLTTFFEFWTLKEAYFKAVGKGITESFDSIEFDIVNWGQKFVLKNDISEEWKFRVYDFEYNYKLAICSNLFCLPNEVTRLSLEAVISEFY